MDIRKDYWFSLGVVSIVADRISGGRYKQRGIVFLEHKLAGRVDVFSVVYLGQPRWIARIETGMQTHNAREGNSGGQRPAKNAASRKR